MRSAIAPHSRLATAPVLAALPLHSHACCLVAPDCHQRQSPTSSLQLLPMMSRTHWSRDWHPAHRLAAYLPPQASRFGRSGEPQHRGIVTQPYAYNPHQPSNTSCSRMTLFPETSAIKKYPLTLNHYVGSFERYISRKQDNRRSREVRTDTTDVCS